MRYTILFVFIALFVADRIIKNKLAQKSDAFKNKNYRIVKEKTGDKEIDQLIRLNNTVYVSGGLFIVTVIIIKAFKWFSL